MKRIWISLVLVVVIIIVCIWEHRITVNMYDDISIKTENIKESIETEDYEKAEEIFTETKEQWEKYRKSLSMFISHDRVHQADTTLAETEANIENQSKDDALSNIEVLEVQISGIRESEQINAPNLL